MDPDRYCLDAAAPPGSALYYATLFAGARERAALVSVHALRHVLLDIVETVADANVRASKLNWWSGEIVDARDGSPHHPVALAITRNCGRRLWRHPEVFAMLAAVARVSAGGGIAIRSGARRVLRGRWRRHGRAVHGGGRVRGRRRRARAGPGARRRSRRRDAGERSERAVRPPAPSGPGSGLGRPGRSRPFRLRSGDAGERSERAVRPPAPSGPGAGLGRPGRSRPFRLRAGGDRRGARPRPPGPRRRAPRRTAAFRTGRARLPHARARPACGAGEGASEAGRKGASRRVGLTGPQAVDCVARVTRRRACRACRSAGVRPCRR